MFTTARKMNREDKFSDFSHVVPLAVITP
jgi:hypothetical protein